MLLLQMESVNTRLKINKSENDIKAKKPKSKFFFHKSHLEKIITFIAKANSLKTLGFKD